MVITFKEKYYLWDCTIEDGIDGDHMSMWLFMYSIFDKKQMHTSVCLLSVAFLLVALLP